MSPFTHPSPPGPAYRVVFRPFLPGCSGFGPVAMALGHIWACFSELTAQIASPVARSNAAPSVPAQARTVGMEPKAGFISLVTNVVLEHQKQVKKLNWGGEKKGGKKV